MGCVTWIGLLIFESLDQNGCMLASVNDSKGMSETSIVVDGNARGFRQDVVVSGRNDAAEKELKVRNGIWDFPNPKLYKLYKVHGSVPSYVGAFGVVYGLRCEADEKVTCDDVKTRWAAGWDSGEYLG
jgi:hypothetical protein